MHDIKLAIDVHLTTEGRTKKILHVLNVPFYTNEVSHDYVKAAWKDQDNGTKRGLVVPELTEEQEKALGEFLDNFDDAGVIYHFKRIL